MRVLITGGAGYIGSNCNKYFAEKGIETTVLDNLSDGHKEAVIAGKFIEGDFGDKILVNKIMLENKFDAIVHFAAFADVADSVANPQRYYENNVTKMLTLLDAAVNNKIKYFVFSSSAATFGNPQYLPMDENHPQFPINPYGMTKLIGEKILADYEKAYGIHSCSFRYFNAAGDNPEGLIGEAHNPEHHLIPLVIKSAMGRTGPLNVFGADYPTRDGSCVRDYIHVDDLAEAHYLGLKYIMDKQVSERFNLGSSDGFTVLEIIDAFEKVTGKKVPYKIVARREGDPASLVASNTKAKNILGWKPQFSSIDKIIKDAWNWENKRNY